jgi:hypothetical protein
MYKLWDNLRGLTVIDRMSLGEKIQQSIVLTPKKWFILMIFPSTDSGNHTNQALNGFHSVSKKPLPTWDDPPSSSQKTVAPRGDEATHRSRWWSNISNLPVAKTAIDSI